MKPTYIEACVN